MLKKGCKTFGIILMDYIDEILKRSNKELSFYYFDLLSVNTCGLLLFILLLLLLLFLFSIETLTKKFE